MVVPSTLPSPIDQAPLLFLADICERVSRSSHTSTYGSPSPTAPEFTATPNETNLHIPCPPSVSTSNIFLRPLRRSSTLNSLCSTSGAHKLRPRKKAHKSLKSSRSFLKVKIEHKRRELYDRACEIKSLDNSPVNEQQLIVLRMVYDEITMYPSEHWMAVIAVAIRRSFKQVKNWFSNERQKNKYGEVVTTRTDIGDRIRLRPIALELCEEWSDELFEETVLIYNFKTTRMLLWDREQQMERASRTE